MRNYNYFLASLIGFIPHFFIWNALGAGIDKFIKESNEFNLLRLGMSKEIYIPLLIFIVLFLFSLFIKKRFFND